MIQPVQKAFGNPAFSLHALRRTYRTMLSNIGVGEDIAERQIAHKRPSLVSLYDKSDLGRVAEGCTDDDTKRTWWRSSR